MTLESWLAELEKQNSVEPHWWCARCLASVDPMMVRYNETHDREDCDYPVAWTEGDEEKRKLLCLVRAQKRVIEAWRQFDALRREADNPEGMEHAIASRGLERAAKAELTESESALAAVEKEVVG